MRVAQLETRDNKQRVAFVELMIYCFRGCTVEEFEKDWEEFSPEIGRIMGCWEEEQLTSAIMISHRQIMINGHIVKMEGLGGVATSPLYRKGGICTRLIKEGLKQMYEDGGVFSALAPFSYEFYEKLGWKWSYNCLTYSFDMEEIRTLKGTLQIELMSDKNKDEVKEFYNRQAQKVNGMAWRADWNWEKRFALAPYGLVVRDELNQIKGYMLYSLNHNESLFRVLEIQYEGKSCMETLLSYIYNHNGQVKQVEMIMPEYYELRDILKNPRVECRSYADKMLRIVNLKEALKVYVYKNDGSFVIKVIDDVCEWNNQTLKVTIEARKVSCIENTDQPADIIIDIRELAQVIIGFRTLDEVAYEGAGHHYFQDTRNKTTLLEAF